MPDVPFSLDTKEDYLWLVLGGIVIFVVLVPLGGYGYINEEYSSYQASKLPPYSGGDIYFTQPQIDRLNVDFTYDGFEVAYCGLTDGQSVSTLRVASIRAASENDVIFSCKGYETLFLHFHPSGISALSEGDKSTLRFATVESQRTIISCVYAGQTLPNCWSYNPESKQFLSHKVHVGG